MSREDEMLALAEAGVRRAKSAGAAEVEVFLWHARAFGAEHSGRGAHAREADQSGIAVRVAVDGRLSSSASSGLAASDVAWVVDRAVASARVLPPHPTFRQFADPAPTAAPPTPVDAAVADPAVDRLLADVTAAAEGARRRKSVSYFNATLHAQSTLFVVANGRGVAAWDRNAYEAMHVEARSAGATSEKYASEMLADRHPLSSGRDLAALAENAALRAEEAASPKPLPGFAHEAVFDATTAILLMNHFTSSFSGASARKGKSRFAGKVGEQIVSDRLTLVDDPTGGRGCRNQRVDDEGSPTRRTPLLERGVLMGHIHDAQSAIAAGTRSTGHGLRPIDLRYAGGVAVKPANLAIAPGDFSLEEMVETTERGVLVRDFLMGTFTMNNLTGDFSFVAPLAYYVESGKVRHPLVSTTVAGNLFECLSQVTAVGHEERSFRSGRAVPLRMRGVTCAT